MTDANPPGTPGFGYGPPPGPPGGKPAYGYPAPPSGPGEPGTPGHPAYGYPHQPPAGGAAAGAGGSGVMLLSLGDITVVDDSVVTPAGRLPLKGAVWNVMDMSRTEEKISTTGIVLAVVFFLACFLGLLFLLMKERKTTGFVQVSVNSNGVHHTTMLPVHDPHAVHHIMEQVNYARSLSI